MPDGGAIVGARSLPVLAVVGAIGIVVGLGIGAVAWMGGDHGGDGVAIAGAMSAGGDAAAGYSGHAAGMTTAMGEQAFLDQMVPHHEAAIAMAQLALQKAQHPEIRALARDIASSQEAEIRRMKAWHRRWFGSPLQPDTTGVIMGTDMSPLEAASGDDFDRAFLAMMIPHHASAVVMADSVTRGGPRRQVGQLADEISSAQAKEIGRMQQWRGLWYPTGG